jgi:NCS1 family nucleobase:cation symporter-1
VAGQPLALAGAAGLAGRDRTYHLLANLYPDIGATLPALVLAGLLQFMLGRAFSRGRETARA